jgi:hypothetical protein
VIADTGDHTDVHLKNNRMVTSEATPFTNLAYLGNVDPVAEAKVTWNVDSLAAGASDTEVVAMPGVLPGHFVTISPSEYMGSLVISGQSAGNQVTLYVYNPTAGVLDLAEGTYHIKAMQFVE